MYHNWGIISVKLLFSYPLRSQPEKDVISIKVLFFLNFFFDFEIFSCIINLSKMINHDQKIERDRKSDKERKKKERKEGEK